MPRKSTQKRVRAKKAKSPFTRAGEFVREEIDHIREGKHGARSARQAIAIGLSKARKVGIPIPERSARGAAHRKSSAHARPQTRPSARRSRAVSTVLRRGPRAAASHAALSKQGHSAAQRRSSQSRHQAAMKGVRAKSSAGLRAAVRKAARSRFSSRRAA